MNFIEILDSINGLTEEQLLMLSSCVITELKTARARKAAAVKDTLAVGDSVRFTGRQRGRRGARFPVEGTITKIKRKNAEVFAQNQRWNVSIGLLQKLVG